MKITADFTKITGRVKPMHAIGQPPRCGHSKELFHYLREAGIPYSRLHDVGGWMGGGLYVDIPNLFRDFDADETDPASYDFAFTDWLISALMEYHCEPFFRLGVTIENEHALKSYRIFPPKDPAKWARICEHVIRHYNEGWADGFRYGIQYWEIWNEPDDGFHIEDSAMWKGSKEEYYRLYEITSNHLKACFGDTIKVGGYASCGFYALDADPDCNGMNGRKAENRNEYFLEFFRDFLAYISSEEHKSPLDFFSWHSYDSVPHTIRHANYCRTMLNRAGFADTEDILNEWNTCPDRYGRSTPAAATKVLAMMLGMQKTSTSLLCFYDGRLGPSQYGGIFNPDTWEPYLSYYALSAFNHAYQLKQEVLSESDTDGLYTLAASDGNKSVLLIANLTGQNVRAELSLTGAELSRAEIYRIDRHYDYTPTGEVLTDNTIYLRSDGCVEIRF